MNIRPIFGLEFEVAFSAMDSLGHRIGPSQILNDFMNEAMQSLTYVPSHGSSGVFLENGGRLYLDCGKPEITTPEVLNPADACRYSRACEEIVLDICRTLVNRSSAVQQIVLSRSNVCYGGTSNAWACHESYGHRVTSGSMANHFIPHAVSRIIFTGAGGFDNRSHGLQFLISPRVAHLVTSISENTQRNRAIFNTKDESLSNDEFQRMHVICGENVSSLLSQWLKMGTTAIVVAMVEAGLSPGRGLGLREPVKAMRAFSEDPTLAATAMMTSGERLTAIEIQRRILESAKGLSVNGSFQAWLPTCLELWESTLDRLEQGPEAVQRTFDWAIKLDLFKTFVQRRGMTWERLQRWNRLLCRLDRRPLSPEQAELRFSLLRSTHQTAAAIRECSQLAADNDLDWDELEGVLKLRQELFELDTRFGQLGDQGIFNSLDRAGLLSHAAPGVEDIEAAKRNPPREGRASVRGAVIKRLAAQRGTISCEWRGMWDYDNRKYLDLSDPFTESETWTALPEAREPASATHILRLRRTFSHAMTLYDRGEYDGAARMLEMIREWSDMLRVPVRRDVGRVTAWVLARRGFLNGADELARIQGSDPTNLAALGDLLQVYRFQGLVPGPDFGACCERGLQMLMAEESPATPGDVAMLMGCYGYKLLCEGSPEKAIDAYQDAFQHVAALHRRSHARLLTEKAEALRQLRRQEEAARLLADAKQIQVDDHFHGDLVDFTQTQRAKLVSDQGNTPEAQALLADILQSQTAVGNVMGETRTSLLMARLSTAAGGEQLSPDRLSELKGRVVQRQTQRPALTHCGQLAKILAHWDVWVTGASLDDESDFFWKL